MMVLLNLLYFSDVSHASEVLRVMTHDSFNASKTVIEKFEQKNDVRVEFLKSGDAGAALVQAILSKGKPLADVFYGVDNTFLSRAVSASIFDSYIPQNLSKIPPHFLLDSGNHLTPITYGDVCLNYDRKWFAEKRIAPPTSLEDLVKPTYKGLTVVENPATSSPGLAFLLTTIGHFGEEGYRDFWKMLRENDALVANGWEDAYYGHFTAASKGNRPIVVSYASSPPAAVHFSSTPLTEAPTAAVTGNRSAFRQIEFAGVLTGTKHPELARKFIDFLLDIPFQEDVPLQMFVFPVNPEAKLPEVFLHHATVADDPAVVPPAAIEKNRDRWLDEWTTIMLR
jgi:thiamine transport system substrate-binding protein